MKTLSSGLFGCLSLVLFACGDNDDAPVVDAPESAASNEAETADPADDAPERTSTETADESPADVAPEDSGSSIPEVPVTPTLEVAELNWRSCGQFQDRNLECAELEVPIDYDQPDGETLPIAMRRILANPLEPYKGALLLNPGGPGGEGIDYALSEFQTGLLDAIAPGYDIIGFDPRGVGASGERGCGILPPEMYPNVPGGPAASELEALIAEQRADGEQCEREWARCFDSSAATTSCATWKRCARP